METLNKRFDNIDNIKGLLMILIVVVHIFVWIVDLIPHAPYIYNIVELFTVPAFVFVSGFCCKKKETIAEIISKYLYLYVFWQIIYVLFLKYIIHDYESIIDPFLQPYWILWYFISMFFWHLFTKIFNPNTTKKALLTTCLFLILGIFIGYLPFKVGYIFSISRSIVFYPFFILGFWWKHREKFEIDNVLIKIGSYIGATLSIIIITILEESINRQWFYQTFGYQAYGCTPVIRILILIAALFCVLSICSLIPNRPIKYLSTIGKNTMGVYIIHGFITLLMINNPIILNLLINYPITVYISSILILIITGNDKANKIVNDISNLPKKIIKK